MSSKGCQGSSEETGIEKVRESQKWADLVDDGSSEAKSKMDMSSLLGAINGCKMEGEMKGGGVAVDDEDITCEESHARAIAEIEKRLSSEREAESKDVQNISKGENVSEEKLQRGQACIKEKSSNGDVNDASVSEVSDIEMGLCGEAGRVAQRRRLHHVGDGVTSLCPSIQFVKVGNLAKPVKYRHKVARDESGKVKSDPNRWLRAALIEDAHENTATKAIRRNDRSKLQASGAIERQASAMVGRAPWDRRRESMTERRPSSPLVPTSSWSAMSNQPPPFQPLRNPMPPPMSSSNTFNHPFASLQSRYDRENIHLQSSHHALEPRHYPSERRYEPYTMEMSWRNRGNRDDGTPSSPPLMASPLPPPNFVPFYRRQKEAQNRMASITPLTYAHYDVPPHLYPSQHLYDSNNEFRRRMIRDPHLSVNSYLPTPHHQSNLVPPSYGHDQSYAHPQSRIFEDQAIHRPPAARLPPNGEPYWQNNHDHNAQQQSEVNEVQRSSGGVRRDDVNHSFSYRPPLHHQINAEEPLRGDIDLLKRGILNRTLRD